MRPGILLSVKGPENGVLTDADLLQPLGRLSDSLCRPLGRPGRQNEYQIVIDLRILRPPPRRRIPQKLFQLFLRKHQHGNNQPKPLTDLRSNPLRQNGLLCLFSGKDYISTIEISTNICVPQFRNTGFQRRHGNLIFAADVDTSQQSNIPFHLKYTTFTSIGRSYGHRRRF